MLLSCVTLFLTVVCCAFAGSEDWESLSQARPVDSVLRQVIADPAGDTTVITVSGNVEFKETITVNKKTKTAQEGIQHYSFEVCCTLPSNQTYNDTLMDCIAEVKQNFSEEAADDETSQARRRLRHVSCIVQCLSYKLGLRDKDGSIKPEEMVSFILNDSRTATMGISEDMVKGCIGTAKAKGLDMLQSYQDVQMCDTSSVEVFKFVKCMTELEHLYCPAAYLRHSKYCDKRRQMMKNERRHSAEDKKNNY